MSKKSVRESLASITANAQAAACVNEDNYYAAAAANEARQLQLDHERKLRVAARERLMPPGMLPLHTEAEQLLSCTLAKMGLWHPTVPSMLIDFLSLAGKDEEQKKMWSKLSFLQLSDLVDRAIAEQAEAGFKEESIFSLGASAVVYQGPPLSESDKEVLGALLRLAQNESVSTRINVLFFHVAAAMGDPNPSKVRYAQIYEAAQKLSRGTLTVTLRTARGGDSGKETRNVQFLCDLGVRIQEYAQGHTVDNGKAVTEVKTANRSHNYVLSYTVPDNVRWLFDIGYFKVVHKIGFRRSISTRLAALADAELYKNGFSGKTLTDLKKISRSTQADKAFRHTLENVVAKELKAAGYMLTAAEGKSRGPLNQRKYNCTSPNFKPKLN